MQAFSGAKLVLWIGARIVVIRRDDRPGLVWANCLDLPGGGREGDEMPEACVLRETAEEIGLRLSADALVWRHERVTPQGAFYAFAARLPEGSERNIVFGDEGQGWSLMTWQDYVSHQDAIPHLALRVRQAAAAVGLAT